MRQLSYIHAQGDDDALAACKALAGLSQEEQDQRLAAAAEQLTGMQVGYIDPGQILLKTRASKRVVMSRIAEDKALDEEARREIFVQQALDRAFSIQGGDIRQYIAATLAQTGRINTRHLPINTARDLLSVAHAIEVGAAENLSSEYSFRVSPASEDEYGRQWLPGDVGLYDDEYFGRRDEFIIEIKAQHQESP
jgi:hypothetical protein